MAEWYGCRGCREMPVRDPRGLCTECEYFVSDEHRDHEDFLALFEAELEASVGGSRD